MSIYCISWLGNGLGGVDGIEVIGIGRGNCRGEVGCIRDEEVEEDG